MSHAIAVWIAPAVTHSQAIAASRLPGAIAIGEGMLMAPMPDALRETPGIEALGAVLSAAGPVVHAETNYFGGIGGQAAGVWREGRCVHAACSRAGITRWAPSGIEPRPINAALALAFGIGAEGHRDAFDRLGLGHWRGTERIVEALRRGVP